MELLADLDRPGAWMLLIDGVPQSHVDLNDPRHLELEYMRRLGHVVDLIGPPGEPLRVLHLGGGALSLARYVAATRPGSVQVAVESSSEVAEIVRSRLPLEQPAGSRAPTAPDAPGGPSGPVEVRVSDARVVLEGLPASSYDLVVADLFVGARTPARLTSVEFIAELARVLAPSGVLAVNVADGPPLAHTRARIAAVRSVLAGVCVLAEAAVLRGSGFGNLVVVAAGRELPIRGLIRATAADESPAVVLQGAALDRFVADATPASDAEDVPPAAPPPGVFA